MTNMKWETPKPTRGRKPLVDYAGIADELKKNPGEWAVVGENMPISLGSNISSGRIKAFQPAGAFEGTIRGQSNGRAVKVFARFVGKND